jgi:hypothetical protein
MQNGSNVLDVPARFSTGVGIGRPMLSKIFRNATSSSADAERGGCELLEGMAVELFNVQTFFTIGNFQLGISRMFSESI